MRISLPLGAHRNHGPGERVFLGRTDCLDDHHTGWSHGGRLSLSEKSVWAVMAMVKSCSVGDVGQLLAEHLFFSLSHAIDNC